ncbi:MAG: cell division protein SepF [Actinomycetota bacterium]|nr:cell division protein SepF [Actinomycetota bacterium]
MNKFFKKTLSFLGLSDEDEEGLEESRGKDAARKKGKLKDEGGRKPARDEKTFSRKRKEIAVRQQRRTPLIRSGRDALKSKVFVAEPKEFEEIQIIADNCKESIPVIINLQEADQDLAKRVIDFCSGLTYALEGNIKKVAEKVFLITPYNVEVSSEETELMQEEGFFNNI